MHFENNSIHLGIRDGPKIRIPITSLQSNALIVREIKEQIKTKPPEQSNDIKKIKLSTNILHNRFHRSDRAMATIKAHDLWQDVYITPDMDFICTSCKIMTIPAASRGK